MDGQWSRIAVRNVMLKEFVQDENKLVALETLTIEDSTEGSVDLTMMHPEKWLRRNKIMSFLLIFLRELVLYFFFIVVQDFVDGIPEAKVSALTHG